MNLDLFSATADIEPIATASAVLRGFALQEELAVIAAVESIAAQAPFRHMVTPGGFRMSVAMTNCGDFGWVSDRKGYRYDALDPLSTKPWPLMPEMFSSLAAAAAIKAGFSDFIPDACLINRYQPGARMTLHQDKNEQDFSQPIVSVSLGVSATFLFGGFERSDHALRILLNHGDVVVWGGVDRLRFHGILPVKQAAHLLLGDQRINLTFRKAG